MFIYSSYSDWWETQQWTLWKTGSSSKSYGQIITTLLQILYILPQFGTNLSKISTNNSLNIIQNGDGQWGIPLIECSNPWSRHFICSPNRHYVRDIISCRIIVFRYILLIYVMDNSTKPYYSKKIRSLQSPQPKHLRYHYWPKNHGGHTHHLHQQCVSLRLGSSGNCYGHLQSQIQFVIHKVTIWEMTSKHSLKIQRANSLWYHLNEYFKYAVNIMPVINIK